MIPILVINNLGKSYRQWGSEWRRIASWFKLNNQPVEEHWIIRKINFTIYQGQAIGIVGVNGAGKSTLLKMIAGTTRPTEGQIHFQGRIAAILELGMGFSPDLTGRQNVYHSAGLMGHDINTINELIDDIEQFAEIGEYFDQPVRTYSSGMQMRVAFALATATRPDILIVDEALSVGDAYFQAKSFNKIRQFREQGTTLLIVSHDRGAIQSLCDRAILLNNGSIIKDAAPEEVMDFYNALIADRENTTIQQNTLDNGKVQTVSGTGEATVTDIQLTDNKSNPVEIINVGQNVSLKIKIKASNEIPDLTIGYMIKDRLGQVIFGTNTYHMNYKIDQLSNDECIEIEFNFFANLGPGNYSISVALHNSSDHLIKNYEWRDLVLLFSVINFDEPQFIGTTWLPTCIKRIS